MPTISRSQDNQQVEFDQLLEYSKINIYLQKSCRKWSRETSSRSLFVFLICITYGESKCSAARFQYILLALNLTNNKENCKKTLGYWSRDTFNFDFSEEGLGLVSLPCFEYDFSIKIFLMLYFVNWPNLIAWLHFLLEILDNMRITTVCFSGCNVINLGVSIIFLVKLFFYMTKSQDKNLRILRTKRAFKVT